MSEEIDATTAADTGDERVSTEALQVDELFPDKVYAVRHFLDAAQCEALVARAVDVGFEPALLGRLTNHEPSADDSASGDASAVRNHTRAILEFADDEINEWWTRARALVPQRDPLDNSTPCAIDSTVRVYRYEQGQRFLRHMDGFSYGSVSYSQIKGPQPKWSFLVYLNNGDSDFSGGRTRFFGVDGEVELEVTPERGMALIYHHHILHEGEQVTQGVKFVARTDVLFSSSAGDKSGGDKQSSCIVQ